MTPEEIRDALYAASTRALVEVLWHRAGVEGVVFDVDDVLTLADYAGGSFAYCSPERPAHSMLLISADVYAPGHHGGEIP